MRYNISLERIGGIQDYDITTPSAASFVNYINTRDFTENPENATPNLTSDVAPEGMYFISSSVSPSSTPILLAVLEVNGTVAAYFIGTKPITHTHDFSGDYMSDATNHWRECVCGETQDIRSYF